MEKNDFKTVESTRQIRDEQHRLLQNKSHQEIISFIRRSAEELQRSLKSKVETGEQTTSKF